MLHRYKAWNGPMPTTAAQAAVTTGTAIKTMLQIATPATRQIAVVSWGFGFRSSPGGSSVVELLQTDVAATVTAHVAAGVQPVNPGLPDSLMTLGTAATGYTGTAEGSITATRVFDVVQMGAISNLDVEGVNFIREYLPEERPVIPVSKFLRVRATFNTAVNMTCFICWEE